MTIQAPGPQSICEDLTVLIPTLGRDLLKGCLQSVVSGASWPARLIVVDQSESAKVASWVEESREIGLQAEHHPSACKGVAAAMNVGLRLVETRYVAVTHDDCVVSQAWLERLRQVLEREARVVVTGRVDPGGTGVVVSINTSPTPARYRRPSLVREFLFPNNMGFALEVFQRVGPFDERDFVRAAEDNDWSYRALRVGVPIVYRPEVVVTHLDWRDETELEATYRAYARSQGGFFGKHLRRGDGFIAMRVLVALARAVLRWARGAVRRDRDQRANARAVLTELLPGVVAGIRGTG